MVEAQTLHLLPSVHRNGTSLDVLQENAREAFDAMQGAITAYRLTVPNGRDYYQLGPDAITRATKIYERNLGELERIASDLMALQEHLANYGDAHGDLGRWYAHDRGLTYEGQESPGVRFSMWESDQDEREHLRRVAPDTYARLREVDRLHD